MPLLAAHPEPIPLNGDLHLHLRRLHFLDDLSRGVRVHPLLHDDRLPQAPARGGLGLPEVEGARVHLAPREPAAHQIAHLPEPEVVVRQKGDDPLLALDGAPGSLEVEALGDLAARAVHRVVHFLQVRP